jgi:hypothetical protein
VHAIGQIRLIVEFKGSTESALVRFPGIYSGFLLAEISAIFSA